MFSKIMNSFTVIKGVGLAEYRTTKWNYELILGFQENQSPSIHLNELSFNVHTMSEAINK